MFVFVILITVVSIFYGLSGEASVDCRTQYHRSCFKHWIDDDKDCLNTRHELLQETSLNAIRIEDCKVLSGLWIDEYSGLYYSDAKKLDIDHIVPLKEAWLSGANKWTQKQREIFANDHDNLIAVSLLLNREKGYKDPLEWIPPLVEYQCEYITRWIYIKRKYKLEMDVEEQKKIEEIQKTC